MKPILPILLAAGLTGAPAFAGASPLPAGCWMGAVLKEGVSDFAVQVWSAPPGGRLHLSDPKACFYDLGDKGDGRSYSLTSRSCKELQSSVLSVKANGDAFDFTLVKLGVGGTLTRNPAADEKSCHIK